ncbi:hypothetical protein T265_11761 [Opisthorchis viverrini]|uniref:Uncharacterized protein n=1 Tax=Opisthorchis viverrini TaxID=6198 RepID=A0A074YXF4_OPIVI|nr:hypothetical protein T265_11761 [Opisthorchis viverrini]KER19481.1 hypothetical protein T265_11761 [Opisthorchis viverrini]
MAPPNDPTETFWSQWKRYSGYHKAVLRLKFKKPFSGFIAPTVAAQRLRNTEKQQRVGPRRGKLSDDCRAKLANGQYCTYRGSTKLTKHTGMT